MFSQLAYYSAKDVLFIGIEKEAQDFKIFLEKNRIIYQSFRFIDPTLQPQMLELLKTLDFTQVAIVKAVDCPAQLIPAPFTTPIQLIMHGLKEIGVRIIGITGTKGKTTTSVLLQKMLLQSGYKTILINDLTDSLYGALEGATNEHTAILELSSAALADLEISPHIAIITNLYRDHIDYHGSLDRYWEAKRNIMRYMTTNDSLVFTPESEIIFHWLAESEVKQAIIDPTEKADLTKSKFIGRQNALNFLLAKKAASLLGVKESDAQTALNSIKDPLPHRLETIRTIRGITFVNNAISKDPTTTYDDITTCIREVGPVGCVMLGGKNVGQDFSGVAKILSTLLIPKLVLFPETAQQLTSLFPESYTPEIIELDDLKKAVLWAAEKCPSGSVCLLSFGSPPLQPGEDYVNKGEQYQAAVMELSNL